MQTYVGDSVVFSSITHILVVKEGAGPWEYGWLELLFCSKPSDPKLLEMVLTVALAKSTF